MNGHPHAHGRELVDRRRRPTGPLDAFRLGGRRVRPRRHQERQGVYFVDRFHPATLAMIVGLLGLTIADGILTIELLEINSEEVNPFMCHLLTWGQLEFLIGKYIMTSAGLPFLVTYQNYRMFGSRLRVGYLLPIFIGLYLILLIYQWSLLQAGQLDLIPTCSVFSERTASPVA